MPYHDREEGLQDSLLAVVFTLSGRNLQFRGELARHGTTGALFRFLERAPDHPHARTALNALCRLVNETGYLEAAGQVRRTLFELLRSEKAVIRARAAWLCAPWIPELDATAARQLADAATAEGRGYFGIALTKASPLVTHALRAERDLKAKGISVQCEFPR